MTLALLALVAHVLTLLPTPPVAVGQRMMPEPFDPQTYKSPSGRFSLHVDPDDQYGNGAASYVLSMDGGTVWTKRMSFTLRRAMVMDDGSVCGFSDTDALVAAKGSLLRIVILGPRGEERLREQIPKRDSRMMHGAPEPFVSKYAASLDADIFVLTLFGDSKEVRAYHISSGKPFESPLQRALARSGLGRYIIAMRYIPGTKLLLVNWWDPNGYPASDAQFELLDVNARLVWHFERKGDYVISSQNGDPHDALQIQGTGAILDAGVGRFSLRMLQDDLKLHFTVEETSAGALVKEMDREKFVEPRGPAPVAFPIKKLEQLPSFHLSTPLKSSPNLIRRVGDFCSAGPRRFAYVAPGGDQLVVFSDQGKVLRRYPLARGRWDHLAYLGSDRFVMATVRETMESPTELWLVDLSAKKPVKIASLTGTTINSIASSGNGRLIYCGSVWSRFSATETAVCLDLKGKRLWVIGDGGGYGGKAEELLSPEGVAVLSDGSVAVLDVIRHTVQLFSSAGTFRSSINLEKQWKKEPSYPTTIIATDKGGFVVGDFQGDPPIWEMDRKGRVLHSFGPTSGKTKLKCRDLAWNSSGLWMSDGFDVHLLNANGGVVRSIGEREEAGALRDIADLAVTPDGFIFAQDDRTKAIHCFDEKGQRIHIVPPVDKTGYGGIEVRDIHRVGIGYSKEKWVLVDGQGVLSSESSNEGGGFNPNKRRPDGTWLRSTRTRALAADGSHAILDRQQSFSYEGGFACFYSAKDEPIAMATVPPGTGPVTGIAYDGSRALLVGKGWLYCIDQAGHPLWKASIPDAYTVYLVHGVISMLGEEGEMIRFSMPPPTTGSSPISVATIMNCSSSASIHTGAASARFTADTEMGNRV